VAFAQLLTRQLVELVQWNESEAGILSYRYPMLDMEIQNGGKLTVRESQMAAFVAEGKMADIFGPGQHALNTRTLPSLIDFLNMDKGSESPFKSEVYFFSTCLQADQKWGTAAPINFSDDEFGEIRMRCYGTYSYRIVDPCVFFNQVCGARDSYFVYDLEGQLCDTIVARMTEVLAKGELSLLHLIASEDELGTRLVQLVYPIFSALGLELNEFIIDNISVPDELQKQLGERIGIDTVQASRLHAKFAVVDPLLPGAAQAPTDTNPGNAPPAYAITVDSEIDSDFSAALAHVFSMPFKSTCEATSFSQASSSAQGALESQSSKFCIDCGHSIPIRARFCSECGQPQ
jgi:membrane protease subunit (stomatin/prohibitin family)